MGIASTKRLRHDAIRSALAANAWLRCRMASAETMSRLARPSGAGSGWYAALMALAALVAVELIALSLASPAQAGSCMENGVVGNGSAGGTTCPGFDIAIGGGSGATALNYSVAIGDASVATGQDSVGVGRRANATGAFSVAIGSDNDATAANAVAFGRFSQATALRTTALGNNSIANADDALAIGFGANAIHARSVALGTGSLTAAAVATSGVTINGTNYTFAGTAPTSTVSIGSVGAERTLTNLAAGRINASSTDAVNGSQLFATNQAVEALNTGVDGLGSSLAAGFGGGSSYNAGTKTLTTVLAVGGTNYNTVQDALTAVNASASAGFFAQANGDAASNIAPGGTVQFLDGQNVNITRSGGDITIATAPDLTADSLTLASGQVFNASGLDMAGTGITGLASGAISAGSTDAVNGGQVHAISQSLADSLGGGASVNPDGTISGPSYVVQGNTYSSVGDTFSAVDSNLTNLNNAIDDLNSGGGIKYFHTNSALADSQAVGTDSVAVGPASVATGQSSVAIGNGASASEENSVALGANSVTDPVVATAGATISGKYYTFAGGSPVGTVSTGSAGAERTVTNVAAGRVAASSTDAINGSQLYATNMAIENIEAGVGTFAVQYDRNPDDTKANKLTLQGGDPSAPVVISNVARGSAPGDAVNVGQFDEGMQMARSYTDERTNWAVESANNYTDHVATETLDRAKAYTNQQLSQLSSGLGEVRGEARQAAAIGLAAASLRFDDRPGKLSVAAGAGLWRSEGALAFGAGYTSENQRMRANLTATTAGGHWGMGAGVSFTLN